MATGKKPASSQTTEEYLLAVWQWARDVGQITGLGVQYGFKPTTQQGVWDVSIRLVHLVDGKATGVERKVETRYPNAGRQSLGALLLGLTMEMDRAIQEEAEGLLGSCIPRP